MAAQVAGALYEVRARAIADDRAPEEVYRSVTAAARRFAEGGEFMVEDVREGRARRIDVRRFVQAIEVRAGEGRTIILSFRTAVTPSGSARPEQVARAVSVLAGVRLQIEGITRLQVLLA
jgi:hypothetical protein